VVQKEVVPKEGVRLSTEQVSNEAEIHEELRKEHIEVEAETDADKRQ
jgi:stress response protein YsnF